MQGMKTKRQRIERRIKEFWQFGRRAQLHKQTMLTSRPKDADGELFEAHFLARHNVFERLAQVPRCLCRQSVTSVITTRAAEALRIGLAPNVPACAITVGRQKTKFGKKRSFTQQKFGKTMIVPCMSHRTTDIAYQKGPFG